MINECTIVRAITFRRTIYTMCGLAVSVCVFMYTLALLVLFSASSGNSIYQTNNRNVPDRDDTGDMYNMLTDNTRSEFFKYKNRPDSGYINHDEQENIFLDDEDIFKQERNNSGYTVNRNRTKRLPQAIIIGVKKAGTRALLEYLRLHPDIRAPGPEPHFFDKHYNKGLNWYRNLIPETTKNQLTIEKTPSYFVTKGIPGKVYKMSKKTKLIVVFRDPVTRAISDYAQLVSRNPKQKSFEEMVFVSNRTKIINTSWTIVKIGVYAQHLARWLEYFPIRQMHFVSGENLIQNPTDEMKRIQKFLGLEQHITEDNFTFNQTKGFPCYKKELGANNWHCLNDEKGRRHPEIDSSVIKRLEDFYRPFNNKLYSMTGRDFGWS